MAVILATILIAHNVNKSAFLYEISYIAYKKYICISQIYSMYNEVLLQHSNLVYIDVKYSLRNKIAHRRIYFACNRVKTTEA